MIKTANYGGNSANGASNETPSGDAYHNAFSNLRNSFSYSDFWNAVNNFKSGSVANTSGLYNSKPIRRINQKKSILQQFYPKKL